MIFTDTISDVVGYDFKLETVNHQRYLQIVLISILFLGSLTGLAIICKWKNAYRIGIVYSIIALLFMVIGHFIELPKDSITSAVIQGLLLIIFLTHLIRNRNHWLEMHSNLDLHVAALPKEPLSE